MCISVFVCLSVSEQTPINHWLTSTHLAHHFGTAIGAWQRAQIKAG